MKYKSESFIALAPEDLTAIPDSSSEGVAAADASAIPLAGPAPTGRIEESRYPPDDPRNSPHQRAIDLIRAGKAQEAEELTRAAIFKSPYDALLHALLAEVVNLQGRHDEAIAEARKALSLHPYERRALGVIGIAMSMQRNYIPAKVALDRALALSPDVVSVRWFRAFCNLALYNFREGFEDYEFGYVSRGRELRLPPHRAWHGDKVNVLFIHCEQGLGDQIQFARFIKMAKERSGGAIVLETRPELIGLLDGCADLIWAGGGDGSVPVPYDAHISIVSLPYVLGVTEITGEAYIEPPKLKFDLQGVKVGFCWSGNPDHPNDVERSLTMEEAKSFEGLAPFGSLQPYGDLPFEMPRICGPDMGASAAVINELDLVVTVDTSVAHLAGAIGKECWMIAPKTGEWRWGLEGSHSPWYDSIEIFRCPNGDRAAAIEAVQDRLRKRFGAASQAVVATSAAPGGAGLNQAGIRPYGSGKKKKSNGHVRTPELANGRRRGS